MKMEFYATWSQPGRELRFYRPETLKIKMYLYFQTGLRVTWERQNLISIA